MKACMKGGVLNNYCHSSDPIVRSERVSYQTAEQENSNYGGLVFPRRAPERAGQVSAELQSIPSARSLRYTPARCFSSTLCFSPSFSFTPSFVFPNTEGLNETFHRPRGACSYVARHGGSDHSPARTNWMGQLLGPHYV